jgi:hypothetical protein
MPVFQTYFIIREATTASVRIIHRTRDAAMACFYELIRGGDFEDCIEIMELVTNDRGRVVAEVVTHSYSKIARYVVTHVTSPTLRPPPSSPATAIRVVSDGGASVVPEFKSLEL